jgi:hypothetical protein
MVPGERNQAHHLGNLQFSHSEHAR